MCFLQRVLNWGFAIWVWKEIYKQSIDHEKQKINTKIFEFVSVIGGGNLISQYFFVSAKQNAKTE